MQVELKYAGIPYMGLIAVHYWFVTCGDGRYDRWEVWQRANAGGESVGHLHRNLMHPDADVGGSATQIAQRWSDASARRLAAALRDSWDLYPYRHRYHMVPGPNCNTYVTWALRRADIRYPLSRRAIGKNFPLP